MADNDSNSSISKHLVRGYDVSRTLKVDQDISPEPTELLHEQRRQTTHCIQWDSAASMTEKPERAVEAPRGK